MIRRTLSHALLLTVVFAAVAAAAPAPKPTKPAAPAAAAMAKPMAATTSETAIFAMGCFWCGETQFEEQPGVLSVVSGYAGGPEKNPTYEQVGGGETGHYESIQVTFDPRKTTYAKMLDLFWHGIDPTQGNGQFCDHGLQYRSAVFFTSDAQRVAAESSKKAIAASGVLKKPIVTEILPATPFWTAEDYHQDFWKKDPVRYRSYRLGCGRDLRLKQLWGDKAAKPLVH